MSRGGIPLGRSSGSGMGAHGEGGADAVPGEAYAVIAEFSAKPGMAGALREATLPLVAQARSEPNVLAFVLHEDRDAPGRFIFYEVYASESDFETHVAKPHVRAWFARLPELTAGGVRLVRMTISGARQANAPIRGAHPAEERTHMSFKRAIAAVAIGAASLSSAAWGADAPTIVLVHGAWTNGSSWAEVIPRLQAGGLHVVAVHNPLSSFEADVAATRRVIADQPGDVILVGHSYGGAVITEAGAGDKVRALVYLAAFAPSAGESLNAIVGSAPQPPEWLALIHADGGGYVSWPADAMAKYFAPDLPPEAAAVLAATQGPVFAGAFDGKVTAPAYASKPSWFVISDQDQIIPAPLQEAFAGKMGATAVHVPSSHVPMLSQPQAVVDAILAAVEGVK